MMKRDDGPIAACALLQRTRCCSSETDSSCTEEDGRDADPTVLHAQSPRLRLAGAVLLGARARATVPVTEVLGVGVGGAAREDASALGAVLYTKACARWHQQEKYRARQQYNN